MEEVVDLNPKIMEKTIYKAQTKNIAQSPQKLRLVADLVRGKRVDKGMDILKFLNKKGAKIVSKCLKSALANARSLDGLKEDELYISMISVDEAPMLKRTRFVSRAKVNIIHKRRSNLNIELTIK